MSRFASLKGEFEAEGLSRNDVAAEALFAARQGLDYLVKIGGCEAKSDIDYLRRLGVVSVVAPMIESAFAMSKYMEMLPAGHFHHVGVTIETIDAVDRVEAILDAGSALTNVTIGRSDLTASFGGSGVDAKETMQKVKKVARAGRARGLEVTMGGGINAKTVQLLKTDAELADLLDCVETRKVIMPVSRFIEDGTLASAIKLELHLLEQRNNFLGGILAQATARVTQVQGRV